MKTKQQTISQALGRKGERWFHYVIPKEWLFEKPLYDFGFDGRVFIGQTEKISGLGFSVQIKASHEWPQRNGYIKLQIDSASLALWNMQLSPVLLVLYDESLDSGFYSWADDLLHSKDLPALRQKTRITVKIPVNNKISPDCWRDIESNLKKQLNNLVNSLGQINVTAAILPTLHSLLFCLRVNYLAEHHWKPQSEEQEKLLCLTEVSAYESALKAMSQLKQQYYWDCQTKIIIDTFITDFKNVLLSFIPDLDTLPAKEDAISFIWINQKEKAKQRPVLINMLLEISIALSSMASGPKGGTLFNEIQSRP